MSYTSKHLQRAVALRRDLEVEEQISLTRDQQDFVEWLDDRDRRERGRDKGCILLLVVVLLLHLFWQDLLLENTRTTMNQLKGIRRKLDVMDWL